MSSIKADLTALKVVVKILTERIVFVAPSPPHAMPSLVELVVNMDFMVLEFCSYPLIVEGEYFRH